MGIWSSDNGQKPQLTLSWSRKHSASKYFQNRKLTTPRRWILHRTSDAKPATLEPARLLPAGRLVFFFGAMPKKASTACPDIEDRQGQWDYPNIATRSRKKDRWPLIQYLRKAIKSRYEWTTNRLSPSKWRINLQNSSDVIWQCSLDCDHFLL